MYKIRNKKTRLFSTGGTSLNIGWTKDGKTFNSFAHLKAHLTQWRRSLMFWGVPPFTRLYDDSKFYDDAEIVEYELVELKTYELGAVKS